MPYHAFAVRLPEGRDDLDVLRRRLKGAMRRAGVRVLEVPYRHPATLVVVVTTEDAARKDELREALGSAVPGATVTDDGARTYRHPVRAHEPGRPTRHVNAYVAAGGSTEPETGPLVPDTDYAVLVHIGDHRRESLLPREESAFPAAPLPDGVLLLRAQLTTDRGVESRPLRLPVTGGSTACDCPAEGEHGAGCPEWVRLPIRTGPESTTAELALHLGAAVVHVQRLVLPVGPAKRSGPRSTLVFNLTTSFGDLAPLFGRERAASFLVSVDHVVVNGVEDTGTAYRITPNAADRVALQVRDTLYDIHLEVDDDGDQHPRYDDEHGKDLDAYKRDLHALARSGRRLYRSLFRDHDESRVLGRVLGLETAARRRAPAVQVVNPTRTGSPILWSTVYGLPLSEDPIDAVYCPAVALFGPGSAYSGAVPPTCPYADRHDGTGRIVCPSASGAWPTRSSA